MANVLNPLFRQAKGYLVSTDPDPSKSRGQTAVKENDTTTCGHCGTIVTVPPMCKPEAMPYALCWGCRRNICLKCDDERIKTMRCDVIENKLERMEAADRFRRDLAG